jgi:hypothetical protein
MSIFQQLVVNTLVIAKALLIIYLMPIFIVLGLLLGMSVIGFYYILKNRNRSITISSKTIAARQKKFIDQFEAITDCNSLWVTDANHNTVKVIKLARDLNTEYGLTFVADTLKMKMPLQIVETSEKNTLISVGSELIKYHANFIVKNKDGIIIFESY